MTLSEYLSREGRGARTRLMMETRLAYTTILAIERGDSKPTAETAKKIEEATGGEVTAAEILGIDAGSDAA